MRIPDWARHVLAFLISLAFPGLGHYYKGHLGHFFTGLGLAFIVYLPFALGLFGYRFWVFALTIVLSYLVRIGLGVHAFRMSSNQKRWYHNIIFCGLIYWLFSTLIYYLYMSFPMKIQTFTVPSLSMVPTIQVEESIAVRFVDEDFIFERGNLVFYYPPLDPDMHMPMDQFWCGRVIGLPGDQVAILKDKIVVNGVALEERYASWEKPHHFEDKRFREEIIAGWKYRDMELGRNEYFLLGDNRYFSMDSRVFGPVSREAIHGFPIYVIKSNDWKRIGTDLTNNPLHSPEVGF